MMHQGREQKPSVRRSIILNVLPLRPTIHVEHNYTLLQCQSITKYTLSCFIVTDPIIYSLRIEDLFITPNFQDVRTSGR